MPLSLKIVHDSDPIVPKKPPVEASALAHKDLRRGTWWQKIPAYKAVDEATFLDHAWQAKNSITQGRQARRDDPGARAAGVRRGPRERHEARADERARQPVPRLAHRLGAPVRRPAPHAVLPARVAPPARPPQARPRLARTSRPTRRCPGLTHRYPDKALFLPLDTCPVYCRFCTRSYAIGLDTDEVEKVHLRPNEERWRRAYSYIASRPELEDIVISGGDAYQLRAQHIEEIGDALLAIPNVRRMRFATKGPAVMPMKILTDDAWVDALTRVVEKGRKLHKDVVLHTHFNHPNEITGITEAAMGRLFERGIVVRNQSVLIRGVNDSVETMTLLVKRLGHVNVHPYYVYVHDMVQRRRGPADERRHGASTSRSTCAARRPASTRRRSWSTRPAAAASATRTRTSTTTATPASASTRRRA